MTKEQLRKIKDAIKSTIQKVSEEPFSISSNIEYALQKIRIMYDKVYFKCNKNHKLAQELFKLSLEELKKESCSSELIYILKKIDEMNK